MRCLVMSDTIYDLCDNCLCFEPPIRATSPGWGRQCEEILKEMKIGIGVE